MHKSNSCKNILRVRTRVVVAALLSAACFIMTASCAQSETPESATDESVSATAEVEAATAIEESAAGEFETATVIGETTTVIDENATGESVSTTSKVEAQAPADAEHASRPKSPGEALYETYSRKILNPALANPDEGYALLGLANVRMTAPLLGDYSINDTVAKYGVYGSDLGIPFSYGEKIFFAFGDTFSGPSFQGDWRSNVLAYSTDADASDGIAFDGMISLKTNSRAIEVLRSKKVDNDEMTVIPTGGVAVGDKIYLYYMSVKHWGAPGVWECNYGGAALSVDGGQSFKKSIR